MSPNRPGIVLIANPESRRVALLQAALARAGAPPAEVAAYDDLLCGRDALERRVGPGTAVKFDSPGRNWNVERRLLAAGADEPGSGDSERIEATAALALEFEKGRLRFLRQWWSGWRRMWPSKKSATRWVASISPASSRNPGTRIGSPVFM